MTVEDTPDQLDAEPETVGSIFGCMVIQLDTRPTHLREEFQSLTFPFEGQNTVRGNHLFEHGLETQPFDYWHGGSSCQHREIHAPDSGIRLNGYSIGHQAGSNLRVGLQRLMSIARSTHDPDAGVDRGTMRQVATESLMGAVPEPMAMSISIQSEQPGFLLFTRDIPIYINIYQDNAAALLVWTNEVNLEDRMVEHYGHRFSVYRMRPIVNSVVVLHTAFLRKRYRRWGFRVKEQLRLFNMLESLIMRKSKGESDGPTGLDVVNGSGKPNPMNVQQMRSIM